MEKELLRKRNMRVIMLFFFSVYLEAKWKACFFVFKPWPKLQAEKIIVNSFGPFQDSPKVVVVVPLSGLSRVVFSFNFTQCPSPPTPHPLAPTPAYISANSFQPITSLRFISAPSYSFLFFSFLLVN